MPTSTMNDLLNTLRDMMTQHAALFEGTGLTLFKAFATILLVWFGIQNALASASGGPAFRFDKFASLLMTVAFGFAMMSFYSQPIPGFGISFYHLIVDEGLNLANQLNHALVDEIWKRLTSLYWGMETPGLSLAINVMEAIRYAITLICILIAQGSVFSVIAFGYVACAVAVMVGPIFVPFFIVPDLQWLFWGWFKAYSVRVLSSYRERLLFVFGSLIIHFVDANPPPYDGAKLLLLFYLMVILLLAFSYGIVKIPSLVNSIFTGRSGESAPPR